MKYYFLILCLLISSCATQKSTDTRYAHVQNTVNDLVVKNDIPGLNVSIVRDNQVYNYSAGFADIQEQQELESTDRLLSGSIGKTYLVPLVFKLIDKDLISLDDRLIDHIPSHDWLARIPNIEDISIRQLLSHTSGLPRWVMSEDVWTEAANQPNKVWSYEDRMSYIFDMDPVHVAGESWAYSDTNYLFLGMLVEELYGESYYRVLNHEVLLPNGLKNTVPSDKRLIDKLANGYSDLPDSFKIPKKVLTSAGYAFNPQLEWTGGGLASTTEDLVKWCHEYYTGSSMSEEHKKMMTTVEPTGKECFGIHSYGMGSFVYQTDIGQAFGHSGFMPGYNSIMVYYPKFETSIAVQANCDYATKKMSLVEYTERVMVAIENP